MRITHDVFRHAADEDMAESGAAMRGNDNQIGVFIRRVANLDCRRTVNQPDRISGFGSCRH